MFAQQFTGKENDNDFSPLIITGTIAELTESFEDAVTDIARDQTTLAALKATATTTKVGQKKKQLAEAIQKHTQGPEERAGEGGEEGRNQGRETETVHDRPFLHVPGKPRKSGRTARNPNRSAWGSRGGGPCLRRHSTCDPS